MERLCVCGRGAVIGPTMCKTAHNILLYHVVDLYGCLGLMGLLNCLIAGPGPGDHGSYLNPPPTLTTKSHLPPIHSLFVPFMIFLKLKKPT